MTVRLGMSLRCARRRIKRRSDGSSRQFNATTEWRFGTPLGKDLLATDGSR